VHQEDTPGEFLGHGVSPPSELAIFGKGNDNLVFYLWLSRLACAKGASGFGISDILTRWEIE
jgi:hypothetical protein